MLVIQMSALCLQTPGDLADGADSDSDAQTASPGMSSHTLQLEPGMPLYLVSQSRPDVCPKSSYLTNLVNSEWTCYVGFENQFSSTRPGRIPLSRSQENIRSENEFFIVDGFDQRSCRLNFIKFLDKLFSEKQYPVCPKQLALNKNAKDSIVDKSLQPPSTSQRTALLSPRTLLPSLEDVMLGHTMREFNQLAGSQSDEIPSRPTNQNADGHQQESSEKSVSDSAVGRAVDAVNSAGTCPAPAFLNMEQMCFSDWSPLEIERHMESFNAASTAKVNETIITQESSTGKSSSSEEVLNTLLGEETHSAQGLTIVRQRRAFAKRKAKMQQFSANPVSIRSAAGVGLTSPISGMQL